MSSDKIYEGPIAITRRGMGFFAIPDPSGKKTDKKDDLMIPAENLNTALPGDIVKVAEEGMMPGKRNEPPRRAGKVIEVVKRARETFVGTLQKTERGNTILIPDSKRLYVPFMIALKGTEAPFELGHKVVVRFLGWNPGEEIPRAEAIQDIGVAGVHETEMRALALGQGFDPEFPPGVVQEAKKLEETGEEMIRQGAVGRRDFRQITTFTIDPADAKDFDDALSVRTLEDGKIEIGVHIADVSQFVVPGTSIDREARSRATSVYLVDRTIPMLPHVLSNNFCSLNPNVDRLSVSAVFVMDTDGNVHDTWFGETVMHSDKRFSYEEAQGVLDAGSGTLYDELVVMRDLARKIRAKRVKKGAIEFDTAEVKVIIDADGKPVEIRSKVRIETMLMIEDFMLLANENVAEYLAEKVKKAGLTGSMVYRVHDFPDADRIEDLSQFLRVMGYDLQVAAGKVKGTDLNALLAQVKGKPEEYLIKTATLRSMAKAVYTTKNAGHFGLAFDFYTHFTSPIRRYPDLMVHRMLKHFEHGKLVSKAEMAEYDTLALHSSEREVSAAEAERDSVKLKIVEYMMNHIGEEFDGVISGVSDRGIYVELTETHAEGMVGVRDLGSDFFVHDQKRYRLVGERTQAKFALGDPIRVKLINARVFEKELDFALAENK